MKASRLAVSLTIHVERQEKEGAVVIVRRNLGGADRKCITNRWTSPP